MANQPQPSFWLNFDSLKRNKRTSIWDSFHSPYASSEEAVRERGILRYSRTSRSLPPKSPRVGRRDGQGVLLPPWPMTLRDQHHASSPFLIHGPRIATLEAASTHADAKPVVRDSDERRATRVPERRKNKGSLKKKKQGHSRSAEILDSPSPGHRGGGHPGVHRSLSQMSKSSEELERIRESYMEELDQCRVGVFASRSDESLNTFSFGEGDAVKGEVWGDAILIKPKVSSTLCLRRSLSAPRERLGKNKHQQILTPNSSIIKFHDGQYNVKDGENPEEFLHRDIPDHHYQRHSRSSTRKGAGMLAEEEPTDQSQVTVRPGYRLPRSRSCGARTARRRGSSPSRDLLESPKWRSSASIERRGTEEKIGIHRCASLPSENDEECIQMDQTPQMVPLRFNKYNFRKRPNRLSLHKEHPAPQYTRPPTVPVDTQHKIETHRPADLLPRGCKCQCPPEAPRQEEVTSSRKKSIFKTLSLRSKSVDRTKPSRSDAEKHHPREYAGCCSCCTSHYSGVTGDEVDGRCRGLIFDGSSSARTGTFPTSLVTRIDPNVGGMSGRGKATTAVKVSPPRVPEATVTHRHSGSSLSSGVYSTGDQRSSYSSSVSDDNPPPSPRSPAKGGVPCDHGQLGRHAGQNQHGNNSPSHFHNQQFTFPSNQHQQQVPQFAHLMCPKTSPGSPHHVPPDTTYSYLTYHHQTSLEDQGIDVQSPGRSSPGSGSGSSTTGSTASSGGCRNSTTSLDSGRASTTTHTHQHRLSGQSYDSGSILRHSYHSSSSSLGSMEHDGTLHVNVTELLNNGVRDSEVLRAWLTDLRFEEYYEKFITAGYDMPTIFKMTPEDLNAIGITKPAHRKKLKAEITRLNIPDRLPDFIPSRLEEWLSILRLEEYTGSLKQQGYTCVEQMTQLTWEDLEDIGITKLGHQKKVMLAIKRVKDIMAGKKFSSNPDGQQQSHYGTHEIVISREACDGRDQYASVPEFRTFSGTGHYNTGEHSRLGGPADPGGHYGVPAHYGPGIQYGPMPPPPQAHVHPLQKQPGVYHPATQFPGPQGPSPPGSKVPNGQPHPLPGPGQVQYRPDLLAVQVRPGGRGRSVESLEEPIYGTYQTFHPDSRIPHVQGPMSLGNLPPRPFPPSALGPSHPQRSMDDGDITPTNEYTISYEGGGTLPRPRTANKLRPVAKVTAKTRVDIHEVPQFIKDENNAKNASQVDDANKKELNLKALNRQNSEIYSSGHCPGSNNNTPQGTPKKLPPPPPRRSNSISESTKDTAARESQYGYRRGMSYGYMGIKNNLQPDVTPDLPPPPAPPDSANHQHLPDDFPPPPPPLTCVTMASATRISANSTITTASITSDTIATSQTSTTAGDNELAEFRPRRNDSNASFKSTSSTDSDSMPFANENAGTIKQRACRPHPGLSVLDTRNSPHSSPRSSPALRRKDAQPPLRQNPIAVTEPPSVPVNKSNSSSPDGTGDVLNDIGNMLANLTDELDAMLEQELTLKN